MEEAYELINVSVQSLHGKIQQKQFTYNLAETEYNKYYTELEKNLRNLENLKEKKYSLENLAKTFKCRVIEYEKSEKEFENENSVANTTLKKLNDDMCMIQAAERHQEKLFEQDILILAERLCVDREKYDKNSFNEEIHCLYERKNSFIQELEDIERLFSEIKARFPIIPASDEQVIENCFQQMPFIQRQINKDKYKNHLIEEKNLTYENTESILLQELERRKKQL